METSSGDEEPALVARQTLSSTQFVQHASGESSCVCFRWRFSHDLPATRSGRSAEPRFPGILARNVGDRVTWIDSPSRMSINPCCCCTGKDSAITIGIWSLVYSLASLLLFGWQTGVLNHCRAVTMAQANLQCEWDCPCVGASSARTSSIIEGESFPPKARTVSSIAQLGIMGWQMAAIKYERDRAANTLLPNYNTYGRFDVPSYYESYWQSPEERYYTGLFVIQVLCLIAAFFLLFASAAFIYGVHTWSKYLIWPWFPCMISSILATLAYCIMWWCGDVRDYWLAITIIEIIVVFVNIYCVVVAMMYYRRVNATTDEYEGKNPRDVVYKINRRQDLFEPYTSRRPPEPIVKSVVPYKPIAQPYPVYPAAQMSPYSPTGMPQTPLPLPPKFVNTPYPLDPNEVRYEREPRPKRTPTVYDEGDPVGSWVREQQQIALLADRRSVGEANSEPISPSREVHATTYPIHHSRSVPSLYDANLVSHKDCLHTRDRHRSSSRHRHRSRSRNRFEDSTAYSSETDPTEFTRHRRESSRRRHRSRPKYEDTEYTADSDHERRRSKKHGSSRDSKRRKEGERRKKTRDDAGSERRRDDVSERDSQRRRRRHEEKSASELGGNPFPLNNGFAIPTQIVIPPSRGERDANGQPLPQKVQINSEITINYDQNGVPISQSVPAFSHDQEPYRRHPIQSNV
ncbi:unnamed protein product [Caenorhabditis auriculariae]|uniref:Uncharacterized protein n=1 Tax=Caenorhabditis auriculariae TaxID=2777116 RepID=A0A8S1HT67_9PELO|nr:unnamed protein product [Caenorhabditis auriculariae]